MAQSGTKLHALLQGREGNSLRIDYQPSGVVLKQLTSTGGEQLAPKLDMRKKRKLLWVTTAMVCSGRDMSHWVNARPRALI